MAMTEEIPMQNDKALERRKDARVRVARVGVKAAAKLGITPEDAVIQTAQKSIRGDEFDVTKYLKPGRHIAG
jgi:hypothetical protein